MKLRGLLIAAVLLAALSGTVYWSNKKSAADAAKPNDSTPKIVNIPDSDIREVRLKKADVTTVLRRDKDNKWEIAEPKPLRADQDAVTSLVSSLSSLTADKVIEDKPADLSAYGLQSPQLDVTVVKKDGKTVDLYVGDETPTGSGAYARVSNGPKVYTLASYTKSNLDKTSNDLRDKRLLTFDSDKLTRVDLQAKGPSLEFGKNNQNDWQILKPRPLRADGSQVEDLIRKLKDAKMDTSVSDEEAKKAAAEFAAGARVGVATVADAGGTQELEVRKAKDTYYAKSSVLPGVYKVPNDLGEGLNKALDDFRNKKLFDFGWNDPTRLEIVNGSASAAYQKSGDKWMSGSRQMDSTSVQSLIDKLRDLASTQFLDSGGVGQTIFTATVTSSDGKRVEKVTITSAAGKNYAKRENEPSIYELDTKAVADLQKAAGEVKEAQPAKKK